MSEPMKETIKKAPEPALDGPPPMDLDRLRTYHGDSKNDRKKALALELLKRTGPIVLVTGGTHLLYEATKKNDEFTGEIIARDVTPPKKNEKSKAAPTPRADIGAE